MLLDKFMDEKQVINHKAALPKTGYKPQGYKQVINQFRVMSNKSKRDTT